MITKRRILFRAGAATLILLVAAAMFVIGRGHTVYLDSKAIEYNGQTYSPPYKTVVIVDGEKAATLYDKERGMTVCIGPKLTMSLEITREKGGDEETASVTVGLPQNMDGIIINLPALLAGLSEDAYLSEFEIAPVEPEAEDEEIITDEFGMPLEEAGVA